MFPIVSYAALSSSTQAPLLWSVIATQSMPAFMKRCSHWDSGQTVIAALPAMPIGIPRFRRMSVQIELPPPCAGIRPVVIRVHHGAPAGQLADRFLFEERCTSLTRSPVNFPLLQNHVNRSASFLVSLPRCFRQWMFGLERRIPTPRLPPGMSSAMNGRMLRRTPFDVSRNDEIQMMPSSSAKPSSASRRRTHSRCLAASSLSAVLFLRPPVAEHSRARHL